MVTWEEMPRSPGRVFFDRLQKLLADAGFDAYVEETCKPYYAPKMGRSLVAARPLFPHGYDQLFLSGKFSVAGSTLESAPGPQDVARLGFCHLSTSVSTNARSAAPSSSMSPSASSSAASTPPRTLALTRLQIRACRGRAGRAGSGARTLRGSVAWSPRRHVIPGKAGMIGSRLGSMRARLSLSGFATTLTEDKAMAAAAIVGCGTNGQ